MSHVETNIEALITDLDILERTLAERFPKLRLMRGQKTHEWFGEWVGDFSADTAAYKNGFDPSTYGQCDHAIKMEGVNYEIGLRWIEKDGVAGYALVWDNFGEGYRDPKGVVHDGQFLVNEIGAQSERLLTEYARMTGIVTAEAQGMTYQESTLDNGEIEVLLTKY